jgi:Glycosyltransferase like family
VILFGSAITDPDAYRKYAEPGIRLAMEPDSELIANAPGGSLFRAYNLLLDLAAKHDELEALVLVHQDAELIDPDFSPKLRAALADPEVGVVGCVGAIGVRSIAWWEGSVTWGSFIHRYSEMGGGDLPAFSYNEADRPPYARTGEVDTVDGFVLAFSPWVVRNIRFDESLGALHGYDFDFCLQVREAGKKVVTADFKAVHHHSLDLINDPESWIVAHMTVAEKWDGRMPGVGRAGGDWKQRARRAEAEAAAAVGQAVANRLKGDARALELERELELMKTSIGWRMTEPLRRGNHLLGRWLGSRRAAQNGAAQNGVAPTR